MEKSVHDLVDECVKVAGVHDDITVLLVRAVPAGRSGYWSEASPKRSVASRLLGSKQRLARPPSWRDEYFERDLSVKGGVIFANDVVSELRTRLEGAPLPPPPHPPLPRMSLLVPSQEVF